MALIRVTRPIERVSMNRNYLLLMDGQRVGEIENGGSGLFEADPGPHYLVATIDWCKSPPLRVVLDDSNVTDLTIRVSKVVPWSITAGVALVFLHVFAQEAFGFSGILKFGVVITAPACALMTVLRGRYLCWDTSSRASADREVSEATTSARPVGDLPIATSTSGVTRGAAIRATSWALIAVSFVFAVLFVSMSRGEGSMAVAGRAASRISALVAISGAGLYALMLLYRLIFLNESNLRFAVRSGALLIASIAFALVSLAFR